MADRNDRSQAEDTHEEMMRRESGIERATRIVHAYARVLGREVPYRAELILAIAIEIEATKRS